jgi:hypothetical protein
MDMDNVRAAIQAAAHVENYDLAQEIAEQHGLVDVCLVCAKAPVEVRLVRRDPVTRTFVDTPRGYPFCMACSDARAEASPDFDPDVDKLPRRRR